MPCASSQCRCSPDLVSCTARRTACTEQPRLLMRQSPTRRGAAPRACARRPRASAPPSASWAWARVRVQGRGLASARCNVAPHLPAVLMIAGPMRKHQGVGHMLSALPHVSTWPCIWAGCVALSLCTIRHMRVSRTERRRCGSAGARAQPCVLWPARCDRRAPSGQSRHHQPALCQRRLPQPPPGVLGKHASGCQDSGRLFGLKQHSPSLGSRPEAVCNTGDACLAQAAVYDFAKCQSLCATS